MAYSHGKYTVVMSTTSLDLSTSGVVGYKWTPGYTPYIIRAVGITNTSTLTLGNALVATFNQIVPSSATTATAFATLNGGTVSLAKGQVLYKDGLNKQIAAGSQVTFHISTGATAAVLGQPWMMVEPKWEVPGNATGTMVATT